MHIADTSRRAEAVSFVELVVVPLGLEALVVDTVAAVGTVGTVDRLVEYTSVVVASAVEDILVELPPRRDAVVHNLLVSYSYSRVRDTCSIHDFLFVTGTAP